MSWMDSSRVGLLITLYLIFVSIFILTGCSGDKQSAYTDTPYPIYTPSSSSALVTLATPSYPLVNISRGTEKSYKATSLMHDLIPTIMALATPTHVQFPAPTPIPFPTLARVTHTGTARPLPMETPTPTSLPFTRLSFGMVSLKPAFPRLDFRKLTNLVQPRDGQDYIFVTEQAGRILAFQNEKDTAQTEIFLDITDRVNEGHNEEGLLGLAFDPEYLVNGYFYVYYSASSPRRSVVSRFSVSQSDPTVADSRSETIIMEIPQPYGNHNGGQLAFGPDGYLYIGLGDGGSSGDPLGNGQSLETILGTILRIDVASASEEHNYGIPPDNPFVDMNGSHGEIWAYGLRNPWRFSFDAETGFLWAGDVGQKQWEEVLIVTKGLNYGWNVMEGFHCFSPDSDCDVRGIELPVAEYGHSGHPPGGCSITGGYVYRGQDIQGLVGTYVYGDFCSGRIWGLRYDGGSVVQNELILDSDISITSFGQGLDGTLYILSRNEGIYMILPAD